MIPIVDYPAQMKVFQISSRKHSNTTGKKPLTKKITNTIILPLPMEKTKTEIPKLCNKLSKEYIAGW